MRKILTIIKNNWDFVCTYWLILGLVFIGLSYLAKFVLHSNSILLILGIIGIICPFVDIFFRQISPKSKYYYDHDNDDENSL